MNDEQKPQQVIAQRLDTPPPIVAQSAVDRQVATAKQYPRNIKSIIENVTEFVKIDVETAASCTYSRPVGNGKFAEGESIRLAEIMAAEWGNLAIKGGLVEEEANRVICFCEVWDMEKNIADRVEYNRSIVGKTGTRYPQHVIETTILAAMAIARRNAIFNVIPKSYTKKMRDIAQAYLEENLGDVKEEWQKLITAFMKYEVTEKMLRTLIGKEVTKYETPPIEAGDIIKLTKVGVAFKDGDLDKDSLFNTKKRARATADKGDKTDLSNLAADNEPEQPAEEGGEL